MKPGEFREFLLGQPFATALTADVLAELGKDASLLAAWFWFRVSRHATLWRIEIFVFHNTTGIKTLTNTPYHGVFTSILCVFMSPSFPSFPRPSPDNLACLAAREARLASGQSLAAWRRLRTRGRASRIHFARRRRVFNSGRHKPRQQSKQQQRQHHPTHAKQPTHAHRRFSRTPRQRA